MNLYDPEIYLQENENEGKAVCGCTLTAEGPQGPGAAIFFCPLHAAAQDLYAVLNAVRVRLGFGKEIPEDFIPRINEVLAKAEGR